MMELHGMQHQQMNRLTSRISLKRVQLSEAPNLGVLPKKVINVGTKISKVIHIISISRISRIKNIHLILGIFRKDTSR